MQGEARTRTQSCLQGSRSQSRLCRDRGGWDKASGRTSSQSFLNKVNSEGGSVDERAVPELVGQSRVLEGQPSRPLQPIDPTQVELTLSPQCLF